jgi:hypothetical protein
VHRQEYRNEVVVRNILFFIYKILSQFVEPPSDYPPFVSSKYIKILSIFVERNLVTLLISNYCEYVPSSVIIKISLCCKFKLLKWIYIYFLFTLTGLRRFCSDIFPKICDLFLLKLHEHPLPPPLLMYTNPGVCY